MNDAPIQGSASALRDAIRVDIDAVTNGGSPALSGAQILGVLADDHLRSLMGTHACSHPSLPVEWVVSYVGADSPDVDLLLASAGNRWLTAKGLESLSGWSAGHGGVLDEMLAANPSSPEKVLVDVAERFIVEDVADPDIDDDDVTMNLLRALDLEQDPHVVDMLMRNPNLTVAVVEVVDARATAAGRVYRSVEDAKEDARAWRILNGA